MRTWRFCAAALVHFVVEAADLPRARQLAADVVEGLLDGADLMTDREGDRVYTDDDAIAELTSDEKGEDNPDSPDDPERGQRE